MPLNKKGHTIMAAMKEKYGEDEGERVFYASKNAGTIEGVDSIEAIADADGHMWTRALTLSDNDTQLVFDEGVVPTKDGYLKANARVSRVGTQTYRGYEVGMPERETVTLYRPPEEVFKTDSMMSHAFKPITLTHPKKMVDATSWAKVAKGISGNDVVRDGDFVRVPLMLTDAAAIDAFMKGKARELSVGYTTDIDWTPGTTPDGTPYHGVQRDIRTNHHALVPVARGGEHLRFGDSGKSTMSCKDCGGKVSLHDNGKYQCDDCGSMNMRDAFNVCPNCGGQLNGDQLNCPQCGFDLKPTGEDLGGGDDPQNAKDWSMSDAYWLKDTSFTAEERRDLAKRGLAKPDGSYPIRNKADLEHAKEAFGRGGATASDREWINKRAKALGEAPLGETEAADAAYSRRTTMPFTKVIDGIPLQFADEVSMAAAVQKISTLQKLYDEAKKKADDDDEDDADAEMEREKKERGYKDSIAAKDGEIAVLKKQLADAQLTDSAIDQKIAERVAVFDAAKPLLAKDFNPAGKSLNDIRRAAVASSLGDAAVKDWDEPRLIGAFEALTRTKRTDGGARKLADSLSEGFRSGGGNGGGHALADAEAESAKAHAEYVKRLQDGYKTPVSSARN